MTLQEEYDEWKNDPKAQAEYQQWRAQDDLKRSQLPDPFTTDPQLFQSFLKDNHESLR